MGNSGPYLHGNLNGIPVDPRNFNLSFACSIFTKSFHFIYYVENVYIHHCTMAKGNNFNFKQCQIFNNFQFQIKNNLTKLNLIVSLNCKAITSYDSSLSETQTVYMVVAALQVNLNP